MVMVRKELVPVVRLAQTFENRAEARDLKDGLIIIVSAENQRIGLAVDELLGQQQVVIKNLGERLRGIRGISGGCILGDGCVGLIVDVGGLVSLAQK
jgi:two-component system, chemotaxis family, sensor kinase CheA